MKNIGKMLAGVLLLASAAMPVQAQDRSQNQGPVSLSSDVRAVETSVDEQGNAVVELVEPGVIVPGNRLIFGTDYANDSAERVENFVVTNPLPAAVRLAPDADPALIVSADGGATWGPLAQLRVAGEDGATRTATHADVTHVRWTLELIAPGESGRLEYPAIIR